VSAVPEVRIDETIPIERRLGLRFGEADGRPLLLDAYCPAGEPTRLRPAVVITHAAGWSSGGRADDWFAPYLATHGFVSVSCDYRLSGEAPFPAQLHDVKAAIRWLRAHAPAYRIDPDRIGIWGGSAGAHLAALAGVTGDSGDPALEGDSGSPGHSSRVQAVVWLNGVSDFLRRGRLIQPHNEYVVRLFGGPPGGTVADRPDLLRLASPVAHVTPSAPPFLLLHGTEDETTDFEQAVGLYEALVAHGVEAELVPLVGRYHNCTGRPEHPEGAPDRSHGWEAAPMALPFFVKHLRRRPGSG
jgi:acetyl esterase/lipase